MSLSILRRTSTNLIRPLRSNCSNPPTLIFKRMGGHHHFELKPSTFVWEKCKDMWHFLFCIFGVFYGSIIIYCNVFIGPAQLAEIPEGYRPKHWEYYRHPISRFIQRTFYYDPQELYEKHLNVLYNEYLRMCMKQLDDKVQDLIKERNDYQAYYFRAVPADFVQYDEEMNKQMDRYNSEIDDNL